MYSNRGRPTPSEWAAIESEFRDLYLVQNKTLRYIKEHFHERGFKATDRQFKTKVKAWGCDQKKIPGHVWHAMFVVLNNRARLGWSTAFIVPIRGADSSLIKVDKIRKQINRDQTVHDWSNIERAEDILNERQIKVYKEEDEEVLCHRDHSQYMPSTSHYLTRDANSEGRHSILSDSTMGGVSPSSIMPSLTQVTSASSSVNESVHDAYWTASNQHSRSISEATLHRASTSPATDLQTEYNRNASRSDSMLSAERSDYKSMISSAFLDPSCNTPHQNEPQSYIGSLSKWSSQGFDAEKQLAMRWVSPYLYDYLCRRDNPTILDERARLDAKDAFRSMLQSSNRYVFVYCSWMVTILAPSQQITLLTEFLTDCCDIIDENPENYLMTYGSPFHLILSLYAGSEIEINARHDEFVRSTTLIHTLWGERSPNFLVTQCYLAWLKLDRNDHQGAMQILNRCVSISEQVMGSHHVVTINCLAILSRAQSEVNLNTEATATLHGMLNRLVSCHQFLHAYRARQMLRLADLQVKMGNAAQAEQNLRDVLNFRMTHLGMDSGPTGEVVVRLDRLLQSQRRFEEARNLVLHTGHLFDREVQTRWFERHHQQAPWLREP